MNARSAISGAARRTGRWLRKSDRSTVGLELGIIAVPFFTLFLGVMEVSYDLYVQSQLDNAVELAARGVQVGNTVGTGGTQTVTNFTDSVCNSLGGGLNCSYLTVASAYVGSSAGASTLNYYTVPYQNSMARLSGGATGKECTGTGGNMMVLKAWYDGPAILGILIPSFTTTNASGNIVHETVSAAGFVNEYFVGGQSC